MSFDAKADAPVSGSALAAGDKFVFGDVIADGWETITADQLLDGLMRIAAAGGVLLFDATAGKVIVRQRGGVAGTDEFHLYDDGANSWIESKQSGALNLKNTSGNGQYLGVVSSFDELFLQVTGSTVIRLGLQVNLVRNVVAIGLADGSLTLSVATDGLLKLTKAPGWAKEATLCCVPVTPSQITANQPAYAGLTGRFNRLTSDASRDIQGISVGADGEERKVINVGSQNIVIKNDSASATAAGNKILTHTGADITIGPQGAVSLVYDGTSGRWRTY